MRVLFHCRESLGNFQGGDAVQILATKRSLEGLGIEVMISSRPDPDVSGFDLLHIFNPVLVSWRGLEAAKRAGIPVVISPIYWPMGDYFQAYRGLAATYLRERPAGWLGGAGQSLIRYLGYTYGWNPHLRRSLRDFLKQADGLLPNSRAEAGVINSDLGVMRPTFVIPNGVSEQPHQPKSTNLPSELARLDSYVLCVGRLELRKNQHLLISALRDLAVPLVLVGNDQVDPSYTALCQQLGRQRGQTYFFPAQTSVSLAAVYQRARVHALPSWYETPGLASLEAAAAGARIVTTAVGGSEEYFGQEAWYCDPRQPDSIKQAVKKALATPPSKILHQRVQREFTWTEAARATLVAYHSVLGKQTQSKSAKKG